MSEPTAHDLAAEVRACMEQGERAMGELSWTMRNVNWRAALDALVARVDTLTRERNARLTLDEVEGLRQRAEAAERALALEKEAVRAALKVARERGKALADTRRALDMIWTHYLLPISDEQKDQIHRALAGDTEGAA